MLHNIQTHCMFVLRYCYYTPNRNTLKRECFCLEGRGGNAPLVIYPLVLRLQFRRLYEGHGPCLVRWAGFDPYYKVGISNLLFH